MTLEADIVNRIAQDYRDRGYGIEFGSPLPPDFGLPSDARADFIAFGPDESVVVEVKRRTDLATDPYVQALAEAVARRPGWRFQLVLAGDPAQLPPMAEGVQEWNLDEAETQLKRASEIAAAGFEDAALLPHSPPVKQLCVGFWSALA
jgi:REase_AHJR-like protein